LLAALAWLHTGGSCGGGSGGGGSAPVPVVETPDERCLALPSQFPAGFDFAAGNASRMLAASFNPGVVVPADVESVPPRARRRAVRWWIGAARSRRRATASRSRLRRRLRGRRRSALVTASCAKLSRSSTRRAPACAISAVERGTAAGAWLFNPALGGAQRVAISRAASRRRPARRLARAAVPSCDVLTELLLGPHLGRRARGNAIFVSVSTSARTAPRHAVPAGRRAGLRFDAGDAAAHRAGRDVAGAVHVGLQPDPRDLHRADGRDFVLVTVSGALGLVPDDPATPEREAGGQALTNAAIDVIDAAERRLVATIPLGLAAPSFDRLAIDPTGRVAMVVPRSDASSAPVDLAPLDAIWLAPRRGASGARRIDGPRR
jgi:hypothetical protein